MKQTVSKDGTTIAYDQIGKGPALILVAGALGHRSFPTQQRQPGQNETQFVHYSTI